MRQSRLKTASSRPRPNAEHGQDDHVHGPGCNHDHGHGRRLVCEIRIRLYKPDDFRQLAACWKAGDIALDETDTAEAIEDNLKFRRDSYRLFVAEARMIDQSINQPLDKPRIAGGVLLTFDGHRAYVYHLAVHPDFRGARVGKLLLETCEQQAKVWGARRLRLSARTDASRSVARKMYEKAGWRADKSVWIYGKTLR